MRGIIYGALFLASLSLYVCGCSEKKEGRLEEKRRVTSPNGRIDAVVCIADGGATTSAGYKVYLVPVGKLVVPEQDVAIFRADHMLKEAFRWRTDKLLEISYEEARIYHYKNFWYHAEIDNYEYVVEVAVVPIQPLSVLSDYDKNLKSY